MKRCHNCGYMCHDEDAFCEGCGSLLSTPEMPVKPKQKSVGPLIAVFAVVIVVLVVGTMIGVNKIKSKAADTETNQEYVYEEAEPEVEETETTELPAGEVSEQVTIEPEQEPVVTEEVQEAAQEEAADIQYQTYYVVNCQQSITLRVSPSTSAAEICQIPFGAPVSYVSSAENGFYKIIYNGQTGYGLASYLSTTPQERPATAQDTRTYQTCYVVNCKQSITLRTSPSTSAGEYCQIPLGAAVTYVENASNGFYKVIYNGQTGYALASYLSFDASDVAVSNRIYMKVVNCKQSITLRKVPSTSADEFCQIPLGATVEYLGTAENGFYWVSYNGYDGYALASYLE